MLNSILRACILLAGDARSLYVYTKIYMTHSVTIGPPLPKFHSFDFIFFSNENE